MTGLSASSLARSRTLHAGKSFTAGTARSDAEGEAALVAYADGWRVEGDTVIGAFDEDALRSPARAHSFGDRDLVRGAG
jgi:hypothetical protein